MGEKWEKNGTKMGHNTHFHSPIVLIFPEVEHLPHNSLCKNQPTALTIAGGEGGDAALATQIATENLGISPPRVL